MFKRVIPCWNAIFGAPPDVQEKDGPLLNRVAVRIRRGPAGEVAFAETAWEPTPDELAALNAGGSIILTVQGGQPMIRLSVEPASLAVTPLDDRRSEKVTIESFIADVMGNLEGFSDHVCRTQAKDQPPALMTPDQWRLRFISWQPPRKMKAG
jgi:hypothetical protein